MSCFVYNKCLSKGVNKELDSGSFTKVKSWSCRPGKTLLTFSSINISQNFIYTTLKALFRILYFLYCWVSWNCYYRYPWWLSKKITKPTKPRAVNWRDDAMEGQSYTLPPSVLKVAGIYALNKVIISSDAFLTMKHIPEQYYAHIDIIHNIYFVCFIFQ